MNLGTALGQMTLITLGLCLAQGIQVTGLRQSVRRLERKLDAFVKQQGIAAPSLVSQEVRLMAQDPKKKIAAIKLHREQNPGLSILEAKKDVADSISEK